jgi:hypothetical protein
LLAHQERLRPRYAIDRTAEWRSDLEDAHVRNELDTKRAYVEASKLNGADLDAMEEMQLIVRGREMDMNWIGMHPLLANAYMTLLMNRLLMQQPNTMPVADFGSNAVDIHIDSKEGLAHALLPDDPTDPKVIDPLHDAFVAFAFEQVLPADIDTMPIDEIWRLRTDFAGELGQFQQAVARFCEDNKHLEDVENTDRLLKDLGGKYKLQVQPALHDLDAALRGINIKTVISSMGITCTAPGALAGLANLGVVFNPIAGAIAGGALAVAGILNERKSQKLSAFNQCEYSWLYRLENDLSPQSMIGDIVDRARRLWPRPVA